jgi:hypothetical protein
MSWSGRLLHIHIAARASLAMEELEQAKLVAGRGIEGDRYFSGTGTYSPKPDAREVTLIEMEVLEAIARGDPPAPGKQVELAPAEHRRNLTSPAGTSRSCWDARFTPRCSTAPGSIAASKWAASFAKAIRSRRSRTEGAKGVAKLPSSAKRCTVP